MNLLFSFFVAAPREGLQSGGRRAHCLGDGKVARVDIIKFVCCFNRIAPRKKLHSMEAEANSRNRHTQINSLLFVLPLYGEAKVRAFMFLCPPTESKLATSRMEEVQRSKSFGSQKLHERNNIRIHFK
jgi:hypothetical protein